MQDDAANRIVQDVFDHLEGVFHDPNQKQVARGEYPALKMDPKQDFTDFLAEFTYYAEESEQPEELRKRDLYRKLPTLLQNQVMIDTDESVALDQFIRKCQIASRLISQQISNRTANRSNPRSGNRGRIAANTSTKSSTSNGSMDTPRLTDKEKIALLKQGKCFNCKEFGYLSRDCPKKKEPTPVTAAAATRDNVKDGKVDLEAMEGVDSDDSGRE